MILAGSWEGIRMMPEDLSLFLSLSSWVMIGTERTCGAIEPGFTSYQPKRSPAEQSTRGVGPARRVETPPRS